jgi:uncharacterized coiled-coil protein SlyX
MRKRFGLNNNRQALVISILAFALCALSASGVCGQSVALSNAGHGHTVAASEPSKRTAESNAPDKKPDAKSIEEKLNSLERMLEQQNQRLSQMQQTIAEQQQTIRLLVGKVNREEAATSSEVSAVYARVESQPAQTPAVEDRLKKIETRMSEIGAVKFSGDIRLRSESIFGQSNNQATAGNPTVLGNELSPRHRMRLRARLSIRGTVGEEFDWGLRLASGSFADNISNNQTLTDFFNRKPFALDQAFITYKPHRVPGLLLQG